MRLSFFNFKIRSEMVLNTAQTLHLAKSSDTYTFDLLRCILALKKLKNKKTWTLDTFGEQSLKIGYVFCFSSIPLKAAMF